MTTTVDGLKENPFVSGQAALSPTDSMKPVSNDMPGYAFEVEYH